MKNINPIKKIRKRDVILAVVICVVLYPFVMISYLWHPESDEEKAMREGDYL
jgi:hypothetical protein